jgi:putative Mg2+ transporter-C (MgtC) family protein
LSPVTDLGPILLNMLTAIAAGGAIGLERSYHGRPAGFRTHTLVCLASSLLMIVTVYQNEWFACAVAGTVRVDPTRMAQGVMTGIGFLGAGVIVKEGLSVRGLTTAASIWITAAIGILAGVGLYSVAIVGTLFTLATLSIFRWAESKIPALIYANHSLKFRREARIPEKALKELLGAHGISVANLSYSIVDGGANFEYLMTIRTRKIENLQALSDALSADPAVLEYKVVPTGD